MEASNNADKYLSDKNLAARYDTSRASIWRWVKSGKFPPPVKLSPGCTRWWFPVVLDWEAAREADTKSSAKATAA